MAEAARVQYVFWGAVDQGMCSRDMARKEESSQYIM